MALLALASCAKTTSCGCLGTLSPLQAPLDAAHTTQSGAQAYLTPSAFDFLDQNVGVLVSQALPSGLTFWVPFTETKTGCLPSWLGGRCAVDEKLCSSGDCPYSNPRDCDNSGAAPNGACPIALKLDTLTIARTAPDELDATLTVDIDYSEFGYSGSGCALAGSGGTCRNTIWIGGTIGCNLDLSIVQKPIPITLKLTIDPISQALSVDVTNVGVNFQSSDFNFNCGIAGSILNAFRGTIASTLNGQVQNMIQSNIGKQLDKSFCMVPTFYTKGCPSPSVTGQDRNGDAACCAPGSACASGGGAGCVTRPLGLVGTADLSKTLAKFGAPPAEVSLELFPGQGQPPAAQPLIATNGGGLTLRIVTGAQAVSPSSCVPTRSPPPNVAQADLDFDQEATNAGISSYMVGVGLSQLFFNQVAFEAYNAGLLCLDLDSYNEPLLTSSALGVLLPSLSNIAPGSVPVYAMLHPQNAPTIAVGAGTISPDGGQIIDPLLTVGMQDLRIDLYATVDERPVRLAAVHADVSLELALGVGPDGSSLDILLGDPNKLLVNVTALDDKILAESPAQIAKLIAMVLTLAGPKLAGLPSFNLPAFAGLGLTIEAVHGIAPDGDGGYLDVGLFAALDAGTSVPGAAIFEGETPGSSPIQVSLAGDLEPALAEVLPGGTLSRYPTAVLAIDPSAGPTETSYSIDQGLWSVYIRGERIDATSPRLLIQGHHSIDVRTRHVGSLAVGSAHSFDFLSDYTPPEITLARGARGRWLLSATDNFTPADQLEWASAVGTDTFGGFSAALPDPDALEAQGAFRLRARDLVGNVAEVSSANSAVVGGKAEGGGRGVRTSVSAPRTNGWGCSSAGTGASGLLALAFAALGLGRCRRKRS